MRYSWTTAESPPETRWVCYIGRLYVGEAHRLVPENWDESVLGRPDDYYSRLSAKPWRAWIANDDGGQAVGTFASIDEAKAWVESTVTELIDGALTSPA